MESPSGWFRVIWKLENFCFSNLYCNTRLSSPPFQISAPVKSKWKLYMFPNGWGPEKYVGIFLKRKKDSGPNELTILFKINLIKRNGERCPDGPSIEIVFANGQEWGHNELFRRSELKSNSEFLFNDTLTVCCEIKVLGSESVRSDALPQSTNNLEFEEIPSICNAMRLMYENCIFSDLTLRGCTKQFHVHKCILEQRLPKLLDELTYNPEKVYEDDDVTYNILLYAYTGKMDIRTFRCWNISKILETYGLKALETEKRILPSASEFVAHTYFFVNKLNFSWQIKTSLLNNHEEIVSSMVVDDTNEISFIMFLTENEDNSWRIFIRVMSDDDVFVKCVVSLEEESHFYEECESLVDKSNSDVQCHASLTLFDDVLSFNHDIIHSVDGHFTLNFDFTYPAISSCSSSAHEMSYGCQNSQLFDDTRNLLNSLEMMYSGQAGDITIKAGNSNKIFKAHKCILSSRSPTFRKMLEHDMLERIENEITMKPNYGIDMPDDLFADVVDKFLLYTYCGKLDAPNTDFREYLLSLIQMYFVGETDGK